MEIKYKQFVIIPKKPKMSTGKIASQTAHATFMALENQKENYKKTHSQGTPPIIDYWKHEGMCVIVLECPTSIQLIGIAKYFEQWNISHHLYIDEGITEIPMGTPTALATGVLPEDKFWMLETMKLFGAKKKK